MRVAVPLFQDRVSPMFVYSDSMLLASVADGKIVSRKIVESPGKGAHNWLQGLLDMDVEVFVCGGADAEFLDEASSYGIRVYHNVAGPVEEMLKELFAGHLRSGMGLFIKDQDREDEKQKIQKNKAHLSAAASGPKTNQAIDCVNCIERKCLEGESCLAGVINDSNPETDSAYRKTIETAEDVAAETERKLCRIAEVVYFALGMGYKRVGIAFCVDMFREAETLSHLLKRFFDVRSVCCKVGGLTAGESGLPNGPHNVVCNPAGQAAILNSLNTDFNLIVGLCVGCDAAFTQRSSAPVSVLFVKDKSLANNPVGALYSKYYFKSLVEEMG